LQKELLLNSANQVKEIAFEVGGNAQKFYEAYNLHRNGKTIISLKDWIRSVKVIIKNENKSKALLFLDPPYYLEKGSKLYGSKGDLHETFDHDKLFKVLENKKNWMMTYNNCEYIRELYNKFLILDVEWSYGMNKTKESSEIVIISK